MWVCVPYIVVLGLTRITVKKEKKHDGFKEKKERGTDNVIQKEGGSEERREQSEGRSQAREGAAGVPHFALSLSSPGKSALNVITTLHAFLLSRPSCFSFFFLRTSCGLIESAGFRCCRYRRTRNTVTRRRKDGQRGRKEEEEKKTLAAPLWSWSCSVQKKEEEKKRKRKKEVPGNSWGTSATWTEKEPKKQEKAPFYFLLLRPLLSVKIHTKSTIGRGNLPEPQKKRSK